METGNGVRRRNTARGVETSGRVWQVAVVGDVQVDRDPLRHLPDSAARLYTPRRIPASDTVSCFHSPPLFCPWPAPRFLLAPGVISCRGALRIPSSLGAFLEVFIMRASCSYGRGCSACKNEVQNSSC